MYYIPRPWNCTPPLFGKLGLKYSPLSLTIATSSRAEGEGTRFFWIDPLTRKSGQRRGIWSFPLLIVYTTYLCQTTKLLTLPAALSGFRLTHSTDPIRRQARSLGSTGPAYLPSPAR